MSRFYGVFVSGLFATLFLAVAFLLSVQVSEAANLYSYSDTITDSRPSNYANHTFEFTIRSDIAASGYIEVDFPADFTVMTPTTTFGVRNVELIVDGTPRSASSTLSATLDQVVITSGAGGTIRYNLNTTTGISEDSTVQLLVGNHTSNSVAAFMTVSTSTGTTTFAGDSLPIQNSAILGTKTIPLDIGGDTEDITGEFYITMVGAVGVSGDTTETIPPYRFNGAPTSSVGGTTLNVEISLETDELAVCKWSPTSSIAYGSMPNTFDTTGFLNHSHVVAVVPSSLNIFYVRCLDDEGNFNTDDYLISFSVNDTPTGQANDQGNIEGDGTGTGNQGTGSGSGGGGSTGGTFGNANTSGNTSGGGGSGGGSGGSEGETNQNDVGGGLGNDGPYPSGDANVIISGYAFPGSTVYALVDGAIAESGTVNTDGSYEVLLEEISRGVYTFGAYAVDENDVKSTTFSTSFTVTGGRTSALSNVNIMPSILVTPDPVDVGVDVVISGFSIPNADITIENQKEGSSVSLKTFTTTSDNDGQWSLTVSTNLFSEGTYKVRAKATQIGGLGIKTDYSGYTFYGVGQVADVPLNADLNRDGSVNLTDFSILLFWWGGDGGDSDPPADINRDGSVSLTDFSIMLFQWTG